MNNFDTLGDKIYYGAIAAIMIVLFIVNIGPLIIKKIKQNGILSTLGNTGITLVVYLLFAVILSALYYLFAIWLKT